MSTPRRGPFSAIVVAALVLLGGCRAAVDVSVAVRPGGSGTVTVTVDLDAAAARQLGDPKALALGDLTTAGWKLTGPVPRREGLRIVAVRTFRSSDQLAAVMDEIGGTDGMFRGTSLRTEERFARSSMQFRTSVHVSGDLTDLSDPKLSKLLGGLPLGRTPEELAALGAGSPSTAVLTVRVVLPGGVDSSNGRITGGAARWSVPLTGGKASSQTLRAAASDRRTSTLLLVGVGVVMVVAALVLVATSTRSGRDPVSEH
ncbi:MAG: hypothetical protein JST64_02185 [Actinobacteria bacterium]|nr:hypothetical protein [Actinomycetota bacterium]